MTRSVPSEKTYNRNKDKQKNRKIGREFNDGFDADLIIDFQGKQYIVEMKIWHGEKYNARGEEQLLGYLNVNVNIKMFNKWKIKMYSYPVSYSSG